MIYRKIERAVVFCNDNVSSDGTVTNVPIYMLMFLKAGQREDLIYKLDLEGISQ